MSDKKVIQQHRASLLFRLSGISANLQNCSIQCSAIPHANDPLLSGTPDISLELQELHKAVDAVSAKLRAYYGFRTIEEAREAQLKKIFGEDYHHANSN